jgi:hypothetical protein
MPEALGQPAVLSVAEAVERHPEPVLLIIPACCSLRSWCSTDDVLESPTCSPILRMVGPSPYLRHTCITDWLNAGIPMAEAARRTGDSPEVIHRRYEGCTDGHEEVNNRKIEKATGWAEGAVAQPHLGRCEQRSLWAPAPRTLHVNGPRPTGLVGGFVAVRLAVSDLSFRGITTSNGARMTLSFARSTSPRRCRACRDGCCRYTNTFPVG